MTATACTIVARNYLAAARVLHASFAAHHPQVEFCVLLVDDERADAAVEDREPFRVLRLSTIGLSPDEIAVLAAIYDVTELATAVKPKLLSWLMAQGRDAVLYLDPDIVVFAPLDEAFDGARQHALVLTPHTMVPFPRDGRHIGSDAILAAGVYNLGFVAVGASGGAFLDWWWEQTRREALSDPRQMMFTDQRWIDLAPCLFDHTLLKHPGYNVAYWNLHGRRVAATASGYEVNGVPLKFFHFSGFDYRRPHLLSKHQTDQPRILLSEHPAVAALCRDYGTALVQYGATAAAEPYGWNETADGLRMTSSLRRLYWRAVVKAEKDGKPIPPGPFDPAGPQAFLAWLNEPRLPLARPVISRYLLDIYDRRGDLQTHYPDLAGTDGAGFLEWIVRDGVKQESIPPPLLPTPGDVERARAPLFVHPDDTTPGVNMAGYFLAELGVGESARQISETLKAGGVPTETLVYGATDSRQQHAYEVQGSGQAAHDVNLICVNADMLPSFRRSFGSGFFAGRHIVGYWFWEVDDFPAEMWPALDIVDEVWVASSFVAEAVRRVSPKPVHCLPHGLAVPQLSPTITRRDVGLPDGFVFLFAFDYLSVFERKNPCDLVAAFTAAFAPGEGPFLVLKSINGDKRIGDRERLLAHIGDRRDILLLEDYLTGAQKNALIGLADCYVSLHRSEGLGLTMAEAMGLGKPVIATGYSGNVEFMTDENSFLVDYRLVPVPSGCEPYPPGTPWAQPDVAQAAALMRTVYLDQHAAAEKGRRARADILSTHSAATRAGAITARLAEVRAERAARAAAAPPRTYEWQELLTRAESHLPPGPGESGGARGTFRRLLLRVLRPYWFPQRILQQLLIDGLRTSDQRATAANVETRRFAETANRRMERRLEQAMARLDRLERAGEPAAREDVHAQSVE